MSTKTLVENKMGSFLLKKVKEKKEVDYKMKYLLKKNDFIGLICDFAKDPYKKSLELELLSPNIYNKTVPDLNLKESVKHSPAKFMQDHHNLRRIYYYFGGYFASLKLKSIIQMKKGEKWEVRIMSNEEEN